MLGTDDLVKYMRRLGIVGEVIRLNPSEAKTSQSAAKAVGCDVSQIAKSIVLKGKSNFYLVILSGDKRIDFKKASEVIGEAVTLAKPDEILAKTGYSVGGVPPFGHAEQIKTYLDKSLLRFEEVYSSGGSEDTLLRIKVSELLKLYGQESLVDFSK